MRQTSHSRKEATGKTGGRGTPPSGTAPAETALQKLPAPGTFRITPEDPSYWHVLQLGVTRISGPY